MRASKIRKLLIAKSILLQEYPNRATLNGIDHILSAYLAKVGRNTYLSEMLGPLAVMLAIEARFYSEIGHEIGFDLIEGETVTELLRRVEWPFKVEVGNIVRYL